MLQFNHFNFNVLDLERSLAFYRQALELEVVEEKEAGDGSFKLVYLGDGGTGFRLELTWLQDSYSNRDVSKYTITIGLYRFYFSVKRTEEQEKNMFFCSSA